MKTPEDMDELVQLACDAYVAALAPTYVVDIPVDKKCMRAAIAAAIRAERDKLDAANTALRQCQADLVFVATCLDTAVENSVVTSSSSRDKLRAMNKSITDSGVVKRIKQAKEALNVPEVEK